MVSSPSANVTVPMPNPFAPLELPPAAKEILTNVYGGALVGVMLTSILFGAISLQTWSYFKHFPHDKIYIKLMVIFSWALQAFEVIGTTWAIYWYFITNYGDVLLLNTAIWEGTIYQTVTVAASMTAQSFFAYRVYSLSHSVLLGLLVETLVIAQCALGTITSTKAYIYGTFSEILLHEKWLVLTWLTLEAASDTAIAIALVVLLKKSRTGFRSTDGMINDMIFYTINTGLITSVVAIITLIVFAIKGFHFLVLALAPPLGGLYTVTMLANLHSRTALREKYVGRGADVTSPLPMHHVSDEYVHYQRHMGGLYPHGATIASGKSGTLGGLRFGVGSGVSNVSDDGDHTFTAMPGFRRPRTLSGSTKRTDRTTSAALSNPYFASPGREKACVGMGGVYSPTTPPFPPSALLSPGSLNTLYSVPGSPVSPVTPPSINGKAHSRKSGASGSQTSIATPISPTTGGFGFPYTNVTGKVVEDYV